MVILVIVEIFPGMCCYFTDCFDVPNFENTIDWINNKFSADRLPKVAFRVAPEDFCAHPSIVVFYRKGESKTLPELVAELRVSVLKFVFIVPTFNIDDPDYTNPETYKIYWDTFKHFNNFKSWIFEDFSNDIKKDLIYKLNFEISNPNEK